MAKRITCELQRVFQHDHSVIWQVFDLQSFLTMVVLLLLLYENEQYVVPNSLLFQPTHLLLTKSMYLSLCLQIWNSMAHNDCIVCANSVFRSMIDVLNSIKVSWIWRQPRILWSSSFLWRLRFSVTDFFCSDSAFLLIVPLRPFKSVSS